MAELKPEEKLNKQETPQERAERIMEEVRRYFVTDLGNMEPTKGYEEKSGVQDCIKFLSENYDNGIDLRRKMMRAIDNKDKGKIKILSSEALTWAHHAIHEPANPDKLKDIQRRWEIAPDEFERQYVQTTERTLRALQGEISPEDVKKMRSVGELTVFDEKLEDIVQTQKDMVPEKIKTLQTEIASVLERLRAFKPKIAEIAKTKMFPPHKKEEGLKQYSSTYQEYDLLRKNVIQLLEKTERA